jgi:long-chain acyl-CoA synthetase
MYIGTHAEVQPDKVAVYRPSTYEHLTYRQLDEASNRLAQLLRARGLRRGDHVAVLLDNCLEYFEIIWACLRSGLYLTPINRYLTASEAAYIVNNCDARVLIASAALEASEELGRLASGCELKLAVGGVLDGFTGYRAAVAVQPPARLEREHIGAFMPYSSGTTGRPKGILFPLPEGVLSEGIQTLDFSMFNIDASTVYLSPAPLYHSSPIMYVSGVTMAGGTVVMMDKFEPSLALELIERYRVTHSQWVPTMFVRMLKLDPEQRAGWDLTSHRCAIHAAAPCPVEVKRQMIEWWGPIVEEFYASTEGAGASKISSSEWLEHPGSVGKPFAPIHVCDEAGNELPPGEPGLIYGEYLLKSGPPSYYKEYFRSQEAFHPHNRMWMTVGDIGYVDKDGYLYLTDRKAFMIISGGVNIYPQQIEDVLALHPKVSDVAVIGVPNADLGEEVKAVVEPAPGVEPSDELAQEIMDFVQKKLGRQLTPRSVDFTDALPRLPTGKLYKKLLRDKYWDFSGTSPFNLSG